MGFRIEGEGRERRAVNDDLAIVAQKRSIREVDIFEFTRNDKPVLVISCTLHGRQISSKEKIDNPDVKCNEVLIYNVNRPTDPNEIHKELGRIGDFLTDFFEVYQYVAGVGCRMNGEPCKALVEVKFGMSKQYRE